MRTFEKVRPGETRELRVPANALPPAIAAAEAEDTVGTGIHISHTGAPSHLLANWFSVDQSRDLVIETPLQGPAPNSHGGGNNPLTLEGDAASILFVKNTGNEPAVLVANFRYHGGEYTVGLRDLGPGETYTLDFRKLRDLQVPDDHGRLLPLEVEHGQVYWRRYSGPPLIGRTHLLSRSQRWADSMSCQPCNCHPADVWMGVSPGSWNKLVGESQPHSATKYENGCYGFMGYSFSPGSWSSANPPAIPVSGSGVASCSSPANASITGHDWAIVYFSYDPYGGCEVYDYPIAANAAGACTCGDVRDTIISEYVDLNRLPIPVCADFTQSKSSPNFPFSEMNGGTYSWAIIQQRLLDKLEQTRVNVGNLPINVISGYRNPVYNDTLSGSSATSRHQWGDAADGCPTAGFDRDTLAQAAELANFNEVILKTTCVHMATK